MHFVQFEISKPTDDSTFEDMCARVYGEIFNDPLPKTNGRRGQAQAGIDVFVNSAMGRIGIQCKRYADGRLTVKHIEQEVLLADKAESPIVRLVVATTATSDARVVRKVQDLSDNRQKEGLCPVEVEFWQDICRHIRGSAKLQNDYAPNAPGAMFHRQDEKNLDIQLALLRIEGKLDTSTGLPGSRPESVNKFVSLQLDAVNDVLKVCRFQDAYDDLQRIGQDLSLFDDHQRARWHLQRGVCTWHLDSGLKAAADFLRAAELYPDDEKMVAAKIRGLLLLGDVTAALAASPEAQARFPTSVHVWIACTNARMVNGELISLDDVPLRMRESCDVLQLLAWAYKKAGNLAGAVGLSEQALALPHAGFFVRSTALALALEAATEDPVKSAYRLIDPCKIVALEKAICALSPRKERLWCAQCPESLADTLVHLGYGYIVLGRAEDALALVEEARHADMLSPRLKRVALDAYRRLDRLDELLMHARLWLNELEEEALLLVAEAASEAGDVELVTATSDAAAHLALSQPETPNLLIAMRWLALWRTCEGRPQAIEDVKTAHLATAQSLPLICGGARILHYAGEVAETDAIIARALTLVQDTSPPEYRLLLADLLFATDNFGHATKHYERLVVYGCHSVLHNRLLECYVQSGARHKARELLKSFPDGWTSDDKARELAIEVGHQASDWSFLTPLAEMQCSRTPDAAGSWLLRLILDLKTKRMHRFHLTLEDVPEELKGSHRQIAQIATTELRFGNKDRGMWRLYRLFRRNMDNVEAASAYFMSIVATTGELPYMDESLASIAEGTSVELQDELGAIVRVSIDPAVANSVPVRDGFYAPNSPEIAALMGATIGATVELPGPFNSKRTFVVKSITSVYRHLLQIAQERFQTPMAAKSLVMSVPVPMSEGGGADFSYLHKMLKQQSEHAQQALDDYSQRPLTLGILCRLLGKNIVDLVRGWPVDGPQLFVCSGTHEERLAAAELLQRNQSTYVVDAATIVELVSLDCQAALAVLPKVYFSTKSLELLETCLEDAKQDRAGGQILDDNGALRYIEFTEKDRERNIAQLQAMVDTAQTHCEIVPSYGPEVMSEEFSRIEDFLGDEEHSVLLLAAERKATLFTLDGRLALLGKASLGIESVWPQEVIRHATLLKVIQPPAYHFATIHQFIRNRTFVSVGAYDLVLMCLQGGHSLSVGLQRFKELLANPETDFKSAISVAFEFLELLTAYPTQFKAFSEFLGHIVEAALRHPNCNVGVFAEQVAEFSNSIVVQCAGPEHPYPPVEAMRRKRIEILSQSLSDSAIFAADLAQKPVRRRAIKLRALKCTVVPRLEFDGDVIENDAEPVAGRTAPSRSVSNVSGELAETSASSSSMYLSSM